MKHRHRGFSLLELSIVLGIISLIAGAGMSMASGALKAADRITTQERLNTIKLALDSFGKTYGYLPCPAQRTVTSSSTAFGVESRNAGTDTCNVTGGMANPSAAVTIGAVPVRTLGLPDNYASDAWSNKLTYAVSNNLKETPKSYSTKIGQITLRYGPISGPTNITSARESRTYTSAASPTAPLVRITVPSGAPASNTIVHVAGSTYKGSWSTTNISGTTFDLVASTWSANDSGTVEWLEAGTNAGYVVVSHGPDGRGAYPVNGTGIPGIKRCNDSGTANSSPPPCTSNAVTTCIDIQNCDDNTVFYDTAYNDGSQPTLYFDDYVVWGSNSLSRSAVNTSLYIACPTGTCEPWCAACTTNYPGGGSTVPPASITTGAQLFKKVITSDSTTCSAACFWGGDSAAGFIKAP